MIQKPLLKIVMIGHVDHGKSTLIGRILLDSKSLPEDKLEETKKISKEFGKDMELAYITDQLKEEREKNITMDTAQIYFKSKRRPYVIIDAPGHLEFIENMITGAQEADCAILLIDATEGIQEQTRRHLRLIQMLGLKYVIAAVNKMDLVDYDQNVFQNIKISLQDLLDELRLAPLSIVPISAKEGDNVLEKTKKMRWSQQPPLIESLDRHIIDQKINAETCTMVVQDVYEMDSRSIVAGKIIDGVLRTNTSIVALPDKKNFHIEKIFTLDNTLKKAPAGLNIGMWVKESPSPKRGHVLTTRPIDQMTVSSIAANIFWMQKSILSQNDPVTLRISTQDIIARLKTIHHRYDSSTMTLLENDAPSLKQYDFAQVVFTSDKPFVATSIDRIKELGRIVIEQNKNICGFGVITRSTSKMKEPQCESAFAY